MRIYFLSRKKSMRNYINYMVQQFLHCLGFFLNKLTFLNKFESNKY